LAIDGSLSLCSPPPHSRSTSSLDDLLASQSGALGRDCYDRVRGRAASPGLGGLIASLPLVSILGIMWLWRDTGEVERIADHAEATFWFVLPSLPMFLALPAMLRLGVGFWQALGLSCLLTVVLCCCPLIPGQALGLIGR